jgi:glycosyltransferase involved in cell wall biosynthesis
VFDVLAKESTTAGFDDIEKVELPFTSRGIFSILFNLIFLTRFKKGLFHITGDVHYAILALPQDRTILTIHDLVFLHTYKGLRRRLLKWIFLDLPVKKAKYITTISEKSKQEILEYTNCDPQKILVIPNPVDLSFDIYSTSPAFGRQAQPPSTSSTSSTSPASVYQPLVGRQAQPPSTRSTILFLGTKPNKNLEISIAALFGLDVHLRIIGELTPKQKEMLAKFNINYTSDFSISPEQLVAEYTNADLVLFPSTYEGFGLPVIEGFQAGRPVITSNISPMKEVAGVAALLADPSSIASIREQVIKLLSNQALQRELVSAGKERVKQYQPDFISQTYQKLWSSL